MLLILSQAFTVHFAVYIAATETEISVPFPPLLQVTVPLQPDAVKVAESVSDARLVLVALILGAVGVVHPSLEIVSSLLFALTQPMLYPDFRTRFISVNLLSLS